MCIQEQSQIKYWMEQVAVFNDQHAFEKLFLYFNDGMNKLAFSFVGSHVIAEEVISDTFLNLWRNRNRLLEIENLKVYLFVSVKNLSIKHLTRHKKEGIFSLDDMYLETISCHTRTPEDLLVSNEMIKIIDQAVEDLPPKCKFIFKLVREDGLRYKEISQILNISVKTIDAQMAIASKKLARSLCFLLKS